MPSVELLDRAEQKQSTKQQKVPDCALDAVGLIAVEILVSNKLFLWEEDKRIDKVGREVVVGSVVCVLCVLCSVVAPDKIRWAGWV